ncbi:hypothetical protein, partial [Streptomyces coelicoflavus]|uniref:hypothetical protein n=1 Tax=Streptomyces coelicoflavus TaxID=285562 RepID=UPI00363F0731
MVAMEDAIRSSPPTRECSVFGESLLTTAAVLPAAAGVFRGARTTGSDHRCPPRRRGGVPLAMVAMEDA